MGALQSRVEAALTVRDRYWDACVADLPSDLFGKTVAITGTTSGTGRAFAEFATWRGARVIMLNRPSPRADAAMRALRDVTPSASLHHVDCDLQSFKSVRAAAAAVAKLTSNLDVLVLNSGVMCLADERTEDGFDVQMQVNVLSHFLLAKLLWPLIQAAGQETGDARIVSHASVARLRTTLDGKYFDRHAPGDLGGDSTAARTARYQQTKLANVVFTRCLEDRIRADALPVKALVAHPGVAATDLGVAISSEGPLPGFMLKPVLRLVSQSSNDGALGILVCAFAPNAANGDFWGPGAGARAFAGPPVLIAKEDASSNATTKDLLWRKCEAAVGETFEL